LGSLFVFSPAHADLNTGLVANYSFDDCTAKDVSGNGHDGTINGNPQCVDGSKGKAFSFDGSRDYIDLGDSADFSASNKVMTISLLLKSFNEYQSSTVIRKGISCGMAGWTIDIGNGDTSKIPVNFMAWNKLDSSWAWGITSTENLSKDKWSNVIVVTDGKEAKIYINGQFVGTQNGNPLASSLINGSVNIDNNSPVFIGAAPDGYCGKVHSFYKGSIDDLRIYNRALSETEVKSLYNMGQLSGTVNGVQKYSAVCKNLKTGVSKKIPLADGAKEWNCKAAGLQTKKGENVSVTITGVSQ
jgi:hypothetical protein